MYCQLYRVCVLLLRKLGEPDDTLQVRTAGALLDVLTYCQYR